MGQGSFACHITVSGKSSKRKQCAGHKLVKREGNAFYRFSVLIGLEEQLELSGKELIFEQEQDLVEHHKMVET